MPTKTKDTKQQLAEAKAQFTSIQNEITSIQREIKINQNAMASVEDPNKLDRIFDECEGEISRLNKERKKSELKLGMVHTTIANLEAKLCEEREVQRVQRRAELEKEIVAHVTAFNTASQSLYDEMTTLNKLVRCVHTECYTAKRGFGADNYKIAPNEGVGVPRNLPLLVFNHDRSEINPSTHHYKEGEIKRLETSNTNYTI